MKKLNQYKHEDNYEDLYDAVTDELYNQKKLGLIPDWIEPDFVYLDDDGAHYVEQKVAYSREEGHGFHDIPEAVEESFVPFMKQEDIIKKMYPEL